jgi:hypothetical protein
VLDDMGNPVVLVENLLRDIPKPLQAHLGPAITPVSQVSP